VKEIHVFGSTASGLENVRGYSMSEEHRMYEATGGCQQ